MPLDTTIAGTAADSYVTLAEFMAYAAAMDRNELNTLGDRGREAILRRATRAIDDLYTFKGYQFSEFQALAWPRHDVGYVDGWWVKYETIPAAIKRAQMEMALAIMSGTDPLPITVGTIASESSSIGPLSKSVTYIGGKGRPSIPAVDRILRPYVLAGNGFAEIRRA
jgi:hypothetical protein